MFFLLLKKEVKFRSFLCAELAEQSESEMLIRVYVLIHKIFGLFKPNPNCK